MLIPAPQAKSATVVVHQAPATAKEMQFITLEDGFINTVWTPPTYAWLRAVPSRGRRGGMTGRGGQCEGGGGRGDAIGLIALLPSAISAYTQTPHMPTGCLCKPVVEMMLRYQTAV